ncbi:MAG: PQQ-binding-like beta-propeller repeat protein [Candidatus Latescibacteria bacterium]|nr:PQQ-binding-like beta-propeller repeat protein [Candidatus Latescibacterota bacterium]
MRPIYLWLSALALLLKPMNAAADWPGWGGPNGDFAVANAGLALDEGPIALEVVWHQPLGTGYAAVSIQGDLAVTLYSDGTHDYVVALDAADGTRRWHYRLGPTYLGHYGSQNGPLSTPLLSGDQVVVLTPRGRLLALATADGALRWSVDLVAQHGARAPFWGFTSSPRAHGNLLLLQMGGTEAMAAFDLTSGAVAWTAVDDSVHYQSPGLFQIQGEPHLIFQGTSKLVGLAPASGRILWDMAHGGQSGATATSGHPVEVAPGRYFIKNRGDGGLLVQVEQIATGFNVRQIWRSNHIRGTYLYAVAHSGRLFGYNGRILTSLNAATGQRLWRSREPGDGLLTIVDGYLVIATKTGALVIAETATQAYQEIARVQLFDDIVWSPPAFANGRFYVRSMGAIACVQVVPAATSPAAPAVAGQIPTSRFADFIDQVEKAKNKEALIDRFIAAQDTFPVIESDSLVHFIYRGPANQVGITGDLIGRRYDRPMHRVEGTNLFYYSAHLEADARITYKYILDLTSAAPDSLNPRTIQSQFFGRASWLGMPKWRQPEHLQMRQDGIQGRIDTLRLTNSALVQVYLPPGYDTSQEHYPVVYLHGAQHPWKLGRLHHSLDNLIGASVRPLILVGLPSLVGGGYDEYVGARRDQYLRLFIEEIMPQVERQYRVIGERSQRANMGQIYAGYMAFYATFKHPELFAGLAIQTMDWDQASQARDTALIVPAETARPLRIYLDWGQYDLRSPMEGNDLGQSSIAFAGLLQERGYSYIGGQAPDGAGWDSWQNRSDQLFEALFPLAD